MFDSCGLSTTPTASTPMLLIGGEQLNALKRGFEQGLEH